MSDEPKNAFGMTEKEYEASITKTIAETSQFEQKGNYMVCRLCGAKLSVKFIGKPVNERMLDHFHVHLAKPPRR